MVPNVTRGYSFKGLTAYLSHDKRDRPDGAERLEQTAGRVGFVAFANFHDGEARTIGDAAKVMALTVRDAEWLRQQAGIRPGGTKADGPPVWHMSLSWGKGERVDEADMRRAAASALGSAGLDMAKGYQTVILQHTDTAHQHVHVMVNLVHPLTGKQANPWRDQPKLQAWARDYEKARGAVLCHDREAKYAALDQKRAKSATQASFRDAAKGGKPQARRGDLGYTPKPDQFGRDRSGPRENPRPGLPYQQWKAQQEAKRAAKDADFQRTKAMLDNRYAAMRAAETASRERRDAEYVRSREDGQAGRDAIYEKYRHALDALWKPEPGPKTSSPDMENWRAFGKRMDARKALFEQREQSLFGRYRNALALAAPRRQGSFYVIRLALNAGERRKLFEREQRRYFAKNAPPRPVQPKRTPRPATPEPKRVMAERLKAMRTAELAEYDRQTRAGFAAMKGRHQFERTNEQAARAGFAATSQAAWSQHRAAHPSQQPGKGGAQKATGGGAADRTRDAGRQDNQAGPAAIVGTAAKTAGADPHQKAETAEIRAPDRFGRSRNRQPRAPRGTRRAASPGQDGAAIAARDAQDSARNGMEAENLPAEGLPASEGHSPTPEQGQAPQRPSGEQGGHAGARTADEQAEADRQALDRILNRADAEAEARDKDARDGQPAAPGRTRGV